MSSKSPAAALFRETFARAPVVLASAPGRVNLIGEHTDYNGGPVLPIAIPERTEVAAGAARAGARAGTLEVVSTLDDTVRRLDLGAVERTGSYADYLLGVYRELEALGSAPAGARLAIASDVPVGTGLASSAALTVATTRALVGLTGARLSAREAAAVAYRAEHDFVGVRCGIMDQVAASVSRPGQALLIECATGRTAPVRFRGRLLLVDTGVRHHLREGAFNARRAECEAALAILKRHAPELHWLAEWPYERRRALDRLLPAPLSRRARHIVEETHRTRLAAGLLRRGNLAAFGALWYDSHRSCARWYECSSPELDLVVRVAQRVGALGARLTGAGWGGTALVLLGKGEAGRGKGEERIVEPIRHAFRRAFGREPRIWETRAAGGARVRRL